MMGVVLGTFHLIFFISHAKPAFQEIKSLLNQKPFDQITPADSAASCASDSTPVVFSSYPGDKSFGAKELYKWENKVLCSKLSTHTYYELLLKYSQPPGGMCPDNTRLCGYLDNLHQLLCMPINEPCPINYLTITSQNEKPKDFNQKDVSKLTSIDLGNNKYLHYSNGIEDGYSLINITAVQGDVCFLRDKFTELYPVHQYFGE